MWVVTFEKIKERVGCAPHLWIVGVFLFELVWGSFVCFLLFLIVQIKLICSQLGKVRVMLRTLVSQDFHKQTLLHDSTCCMGVGQDGETGKAS